MNFLVLDLETTGIDTRRDIPIQLAWNVYDKDFRLKAAGQSLVNSGVGVTPFIENLTGISTKDLLAKGLKPSEVAKNYTNLVWNYQPLMLIGYNLINFDLPILQNFLANHNPGKFKFPPVTLVCDVMFLGRDYFGMRKWLKLSVIAKKLGISFDSDALHNALADVELTWKVFEKLLQKGALTYDLV